MTLLFKIEKITIPITPTAIIINKNILYIFLKLVSIIVLITQYIAITVKDGKLFKKGKE